MNSSWFRQIERSVMNMISRGKLSKTSEDPKVQRCEVAVMGGETLPNVERVQQYGFSSFAPPGSQALLAFITGSREFPVIISADDPENRFKVKMGESAIYTKFGTHWHLTDKKEIDGKAESLNLALDKSGKIKSPEFLFESNKFSVKSDSDELIKAISELANAISSIKGVSSSPGNPVVFADFIATVKPIAQRIQKFVG